MITKEEYDQIINYLKASDIDTIKLGIYLILGLEEFQNLDKSYEFNNKMELPVASGIKFYLEETLSKEKLLKLLEISKEDGWKTCSRFLKNWIEKQFKSQ